MRRGHRAFFCALLALATPMAVVALSASVHAQATDARLILRIEGSLPAGVTAEQVRAAIAAELQVEVALAAPGIEGRGTIVVHVEGNIATVVFVAGEAPKVERSVPVSKGQTFIEIVALLVGNLARDQAGDILAELRVKIGTSEPSAPASASSAAPTVAPPAVSTSTSAYASAPPPPPPLVIAKKPPALQTCDRSTTLIGGDVVPGVGSSTADKRAVRFASFNLIGGWAHGLTGFELSPGFNVETGFMCGVQISGGANVVRGPVHGLQLTGGANIGGDLEGAQITGGGNLARDGHGAQIGGGFNFARDLGGVQIAGGFNVARVLFGAQLAPVNVAGEVHGAQLGVVNVAGGEVHGAQIGVVNIADKSDAPIGVVNVIRHGRTQFDLFGNESGFFSFEVVHGGRRVHNIFGVGVQPGYTSGKALPSLSYGIGVRAIDRTSFTFDVDTVFTSFFRFRSTAEQTFEFWTMQQELRGVFAVPFTGDTQLMFGPTVRLLATTDPDTKPQGPWKGIHVFDDRNDANHANGVGYYLIPGVFLGLRL